MKRIALTSLMVLGVVGCSAVKTQVTNQYQLSGFSVKQYAQHASRPTLLVTEPEAVAGYDTEQMLYMNKPYEVSPFVHNAWVSPPAHMLLPLLAQSIQASQAFKAVASSASAERTDYRLDTQLLQLQQNFLQKPSVLEFKAKVVVTDMDDNRVIGSRILAYRIPCSSNTPYGGVLAANQATRQFTADATAYVVHAVHHRK